jgi:hypothetical protein
MAVVTGRCKLHLGGFGEMMAHPVRAFEVDAAGNRNILKLHPVFGAAAMLMAVFDLSGRVLAGYLDSSGE